MLQGVASGFLRLHGTASLFLFFFCVIRMGVGVFTVMNVVYYGFPTRISKALCFLLLVWRLLRLLPSGFLEGYQVVRRQNGFFSKRVRFPVWGSLFWPPSVLFAMVTMFTLIVPLQFRRPLSFVGTSVTSNWSNRLHYLSCFRLSHSSFCGV